jgi:hypothetical protein
MKTCNKCNIEKDDAEFYKGRKTCKFCFGTSKKLWSQNNREKINEKSREKYRKSPEVRLSKKQRSQRLRVKNKDKDNENRSLRQNLEKKMFDNARERAKRKNIQFSITIEDVIMPEKCPIFGIPLKKGEGTCKDFSPSLDRIDPNKGYVKGNVMVISYRANRMKQDSNPDEMIALGEYYKKLLEEAKKYE